MKKLITLGIIIVASIAFYLISPKYNVYQSDGGIYTYRFNKITGTFQIGNSKNGKWDSAIPVGIIHKP